MNKNKLNKKRYEPKTPMNNTYNTRANQNHYRQQSVKKVEFSRKDFETKTRDRSTVMSRFIPNDLVGTHHRFAGFSSKPERYNKSNEHDNSDTRAEEQDESLNKIKALFNMFKQKHTHIFEGTNSQLNDTAPVGTLYQKSSQDLNFDLEVLGKCSVSIFR